MTALRVTATLRESAALGRTARADYRQDTYDHVPGSVLRGALAAAWLRTPGTPGPDTPRFRAVFEGEGAFGPLHSAESLPVPLSVWTHKADLAADCPTRWWDELDADVPGACPVCHGRLVRSKGEPTGTPAIRTHTRAALDPTGVAKDGQLYRRAALDVATVLTGWVTGPAVEALAPADRPVRQLRLGGQRSIRGLADITVEEVDPPAPQTSGTRVVLRLAAPGVFVDRFGYPTDKPAPAELAATLGVTVKEVETKPGWTRWTEVGGWHNASGLPKPRDRAVVAGSTYVVRCAEEPAPDRLVALAGRGVGLRRREGYGALYLPPRTAASVTPLGAVAAIRGWSKWPRMLPLLRQRAAGPFPPDTRLDKALDDPTLTEPQRAALATLLALTSGGELARVLDLLEGR